jgi:glycerate kinase
VRVEAVGVDEHGHAMNHVVIAPDKFKGSLTAAEVAAHVAAGLERACPGVSVKQLPVADGGDGTVDAAVAAGYRRVEIGVRGPTGQAITAAFAMLDGTAIIESAQACGLSRLPGGEPAPLAATSRGVGELITVAMRMKAKRIVLGLGGVATTDGGSGLVRALGGKLLDEQGHEIAPGGAALAGLRSLDLTGMRDLSGIEVLVACDVDNPLLGPEGAAAVYGPQKGASAEDVTVLEAGLARWADVAEQALGPSGSGPWGSGGVPRGGTAPGGTAHVVREEAGAGAAGGLGYATLAFLRATMRPGIELMLELLSFTEHLTDARLVITGEGALDTQTLRGKAPAGVARATAMGAPDVPVVAVAGRCMLTAEQLRAAGIGAAYALTDIEPDVQRCIANAGPLLEDLMSRVCGDWLS